MEEADWLVDFGPGAGRARRQGRRRRARPARGDGGPGQPHRRVPARAGSEIEVPSRGASAGKAKLDGRGREGEQPEGRDVEIPLGVLHRRHRRVAAPASPRWSTRSCYPALARTSHGRARSPGKHKAIQGHRAPRQGDRHRPAAHRPHAALEPGDVHQGVRRHPRGVRADAGGAGVRLHAGALQLQREGRPLRGVRGRRREAGRDALPRRRATCRARCAAASASTRRRCGCATRARTSPRCSRCACARRWSTSRVHRDILRVLQTLDDVGLGYMQLGQTLADALRRRGAAHQAVARARARSATGRTLYILDEPTTGLHFEDIRKLLAGARPAGRGRATRWW